ncbi:MAG: ketopantoate reductase family protein, partial [bacterium]
FRTPRDWEGIHTSMDRLAAFNRGSLKAKSGVWRDLAVRKRKTEVDHIVGAIVETGRRRKVATPLNERLQTMIHDLEEERRTMDWVNLAELSDLSAQTYGQ